MLKVEFELVWNFIFLAGNDKTESFKCLFFEAKCSYVHKIFNKYF